MTTRYVLAAGAWMVLTLLQPGSSAGPAQAQPAPALTGQVTSAEEGLMEGVLVSVKKVGSTITTTVVTDAQGRYRFPGPRLTPGPYAFSVRAVGYELEGRRIADVGANGPVTADLRLRKTQDLAAQLTNAEWLASMPGTEDQKKVLLGCVQCHTLERTVRSTHDAAGFLKVQQRMGTYVNQSTPLHIQVRRAERLLEMRGEERQRARQALAEFLSTVNLKGGSTWPYELKTLPRPTGRGTRVVITEYDLPRATIQPHDVIVDPDGIAWYCNFGEQTLGKLDPRTGRVTEYRVPELKPGFPTGALSVRFDRDSNLWLGMMFQGGIAKFDRKKETFSTWSLPPEVNRDMTQVNMTSPSSSHVDGKVWTNNNGFAALDRLDAQRSGAEARHEDRRLHGVPAAALDEHPARVRGQLHHAGRVLGGQQPRRLHRQAGAAGLGDALSHALRDLLLLPGRAVAQPRRGRAPRARADGVDGGTRLRPDLADRAPLHRLRPRGGPRHARRRRRLPDAAGTHRAGGGDPALPSSAAPGRADGARGHRLARPAGGRVRPRQSPGGVPRLQRATAGEPRPLRGGGGDHHPGVDADGAVLVRGALLHDPRHACDAQAVPEAAPAALPGMRQQGEHRGHGRPRLADAQLRPARQRRAAARDQPRGVRCGRAQGRTVRGQHHRIVEEVGRVAPDLRGAHRRAGAGRVQGRRDVVPGVVPPVRDPRAHRGGAPEPAAPLPPARRAPRQDQLGRSGPRDGGLRLTGHRRAQDRSDARRRRGPRAVLDELRGAAARQNTTIDGVICERGHAAFSRLSRWGAEKGPPNPPTRYSASHTVSSCWFRKWLGVIVQPRTLALCGMIRWFCSV